MAACEYQPATDHKTINHGLMFTVSTLSVFPVLNADPVVGCVQ